MNKQKIKKTVNRISDYLVKRKNIIVPMAAIMALTIPGYAFASGGESQWNAITDLIATWGTRIGGAFIIMGALEFAMGWKDDRADARSLGLRIAVAGCIAVAVCANASTFLG